MSSSSSGQAGRVFIDKRLDEIGVVEEGIPDPEAHFRRQRRKLIRRGNVVGNHLEPMVHEEHQRPVQLEKQFDILRREKHLDSPLLKPRRHWPVTPAVPWPRLIANRIRVRWGDIFLRHKGVSEPVD